VTLTAACGLLQLPPGHPSLAALHNLIVAMGPNLQIFNNVARRHYVGWGAGGPPAEFTALVNALLPCLTLPTMETAFTYNPTGEWLHRCSRMGAFVCIVGVHCGRACARAWCVRVCACGAFVCVHLLTIHPGCQKLTVCSVCP
jgi:hypothetical protein